MVDINPMGGPLDLFRKLPGPRLKCRDGRQRPGQTWRRVLRGTGCVGVGQRIVVLDRTVDHHVEQGGFP